MEYAANDSEKSFAAQRSEQVLVKEDAHAAAEKGHVATDK